jgi:poly-gamma-glutamate synthesis protein (capsule biosynthesis protein)
VISQPTAVRNDRQAAEILIVRQLPLAALMLALVLPGWAQEDMSADPQVLDPARFDPMRPLERDLKTNVPDGFTAAVGGDLLIARPLMPTRARDPGFAQVVELLRGADVTFGNMELCLVDAATFKGIAMPPSDDFVLLAAAPAVARDLATMGFDLVGRANNHALDWGVEGLRSTSAALDAAGIVHAGTGENLGLARRATFYNGPKARVGLVSIASTFDAHSTAQDGTDGAPVRPGLSPLRVTASYSLPPASYARLAAIRDELYPKAKGDKDLKLFGARFSHGEQLAVHYQMDPSDVAALLRAVRGGKQTSDFLIAAIHSHEPGNSAEPVATTDQLDHPAEFVATLARAAIDAGADLWVTTGIHHVAGIEIYKGRPILYGMGDLFWAAGLESPQPADTMRLTRDSLAAAFRHPERASLHDLLTAGDEGYFANPFPYESFVATTTFGADGRLAELRLYPVELGYTRRTSETGAPRPAPPVTARAILERVVAQSRPFGTRIDIVPDTIFGFVGVIH